MVDIMDLIQLVISWITIGSFGPLWLPKWFGCNLWHYKWSSPDDYWAAIELIAEDQNKTVDEVNNLVYELACGKYGS